MKKLTAIFLSLIIILSFAACGDSGNPTLSSGKVVNKDIAVLEEKYSGLTKDDLKWEYNSSTKTIIISGEGPMKDYNKEAPEWYQYSDQAENAVIGDKVTSVSAGAFMWFSKLINVKLGESVEFIGDAAFSNCECLWTVNFPASLKYVGKSAFNNDMLHSENGFVFPEGMLYLGEDSFRSAFKESYVSIPASLTTIDKGAFSNCFVDEFRVEPTNTAYTSDNNIFYDKNMTTLINYPAGKTDKLYEIPESVTAILCEAIEVTNDLERIVIPAGVSKIEEGAIFWNYGLTYIDVDENNKDYKSVDGVLFSKDGKNLICYPIASDRTEYTVPEGTERICNYSMSQAKNLTKIHTNEGLKEIGDSGLYFCESLTQLGLPKSIKKIDTYGLTYCDALSKIYYAGNSDDWKKVEIGENNELLSDGSVTIYCAE